MCPYLLFVLDVYKRQAHRIHGWTANFHLLAFNGRTTVDGVAKGVEEASGKLLAHFDCRSLAQEYYLCIGGNTFRTLTPVSYTHLHSVRWYR